MYIGISTKLLLRPVQLSVELLKGDTLNNFILPIIAIVGAGAAAAEVAGTVATMAAVAEHRGGQSEY